MADRNHIWRDSVRRGVGVPGVGVSTGGNSAGSTGTGQMGTMVLAGIGGITLSQSTAPGGQSTISISGAAESGIGVAGQSAFAATNLSTISAGVAVFSNTTGFGPNIAATQSWGGGIAFGVSGSTVTANAPGAVAQILVQTGAASTDTAFVGVQRSNSISIEKAGNINLSVVAGDAFRIIGQAVALSAGTASATSGTIVASDANFFQFGLNGQTLTVNHKSVSMMVNNGYDRAVFLSAADLGSIYVAPFFVYAPINATKMVFLMDFSNGNASAGGTLDVKTALYSLTGSTANILGIGARTIQFNSTLGSNSSFTQVSGPRFRSLAGPGNLSIGQYMLAMVFNATSQVSSVSYRFCGGRDISIIANEYPNALGTGGHVWNGGFYSAAGQTNLPASIHVTDILSTGLDDAIFVPFVTLFGSY